MSKFRWALPIVVFSLLLVVDTAAHAQKRVALVIGNSDYQHTTKLDNPKSDATDVGAAFKKHGFDVIEGFDLEKQAMDRKVRDFSEAVSGAAVAVFFYAGHGLQVSGQNYLVPIDAKLTTASALDWEMVRLDLVHRSMEREATTSLLFIDACRNNPLARNLARAMGTRSAQIGTGLALVEAGIGTLVSFSTHPGAVASDGTGRNSPYASALVKHVLSSSDDLNSILIDVRRDVMSETRNQQVPWEHSALTGRFYFRPVGESKHASIGGASDAERSWAIIKDTDNSAALDAFATRYKDTFLADLARLRIEELKKKVATATSIAPAEQKKSPVELKTGATGELSEHLMSDRFAVALLAARAIKDNAGRVGTLAAIAEGQEAAGLTKDALATLAEATTEAQRNMSSPPLYALRAAHVKAGRFDDAIKLALQENYYRAFALQQIGEAQAKAGLSEEAASTFERAAEAVLSIKKADVPGSLTLSEQYLRATSLAAIAGTQAKVSLSDTAKMNFEKSIALAETIADRAERGKAFRSIAYSQVTYGLIAEAVATLATAAQLPFASDASSVDYYFFGSSLAKAGKRAEAIAQYRKAVDIESARSKTDQYSSFSSLFMIVESCIASGLADECAALTAQATEVAKAVAVDWVRVSVLLAKLETQLGPGKSKDAATTFGQLLQVTRGIFSEPMRIEAMLGIGTAQAAAGLAKDASTTFESAERAVTSLGNSNAIQSMGYAISSAKQSDLTKPDRVREAMRAIQNRWAQPYLLVNIAKAQHKAGLGEASATFAQALKGAQARTEDYARSSDLATVAKGYADVGLFADAVRIAVSINDIKDGDHNSSDNRWGALKEISEAQIKAGLIADASTTLAQAVKAARSQTDKSSRAWKLAVTAQLLAKVGLTKDATTVLDEALELTTSQEMNAGLRGLLASIAEGQAAVRLVRDTAITVDRIIKARVDESGGYSFPNHNFAQIAKALAN